jgi:outer membrane protein assembly factor BamB/ankyrin repeat protein
MRTTKTRRRAEFAAALLYVALATASGALGQQVEKGALKWSFKAGNWVDAPAIAADGTVYAGVRGKGLYAFSPDGEPKWVFGAGDRSVLQRSIAPHLGDLVGYSLLAIAADGTLYLGNDNEIHALSADGKRQWTFSVPASQLAGFSTAALGADGTIYVVNRNNSLYALMPSGKRKWFYEMRRGRFSAGPTAPAVGADGTIYAGDFGNYIHALTPEGKPKWTVRVQEEGRIVALALAADGTIYMASGPEEPSRRTAIRAFTPEGQHKWSYELAKGVPFDPVPPVVGRDGTIYSGLFNLIALTPEGKRKWIFNMEGSSKASPSIGADGTIYVVTDRLYAVSPQGTLMWSSKPVMGPLARSSPAIAADGTIYVGTDGERGRPEEGTLFAFRSSSPGHGAGPWPTDHARWMKHGGGQKTADAREVEPIPSPPPPATGPQAEAREALQKHDIPFAPERFLECAGTGDIACVNLFLAAGMSLEVQDERGTNALMRALYGRHIDVARVLIDKGADVNARRKDGATVLWAAAHAGRLDFVELLLAKGANPDIQDSSGGTALMRAAYRGDATMAKALLEKGANPNLRTKRGSTALMNASQFGYAEVVKLLLGSGADVSAKDNDGRTALDHAKRGSRPSPGVIAMLEEAAMKK